MSSAVMGVASALPGRCLSFPAQFLMFVFRKALQPLPLGVLNCPNCGRDCSEAGVEQGCRISAFNVAQAHCR